jgi:radical SAM superfamily enzyme YgiQ (UPF0313 family)
MAEKHEQKVKGGARVAPEARITRYIRLLLKEDWEGLKKLDMGFAPIRPGNGVIDKLVAKVFFRVEQYMASGNWLAAESMMHCLRAVFEDENSTAKYCFSICMGKRDWGNAVKFAEKLIAGGAFDSRLVADLKALKCRILVEKNIQAVRGFAQKNDYAQAGKLLDQALSADPGNRDYRNLREEIRQRMSKKGDAGGDTGKKHKMLLIGMPWWSVEHPFCAVAYVGGVVKKAGWDCRIEDLNVLIFRQASDEDSKSWDSDTTWKDLDATAQIYERYRGFIEGYLRDLVAHNEFDVIAFTVNQRTNFFSFKAAEFVKSIAPGTPILFGGMDCFPAYQNTRLFKKNRGVPDIICQGECEVALPLFLKEFGVTKDYRTRIPGFAYVSDGTIVNTGEPELPDLFNSDVIADYSQFDFSLYIGPGGFPSFFTRGCINRCNFCGESPIFKRFRYRNPAVVIREIREGAKYASRVHSVHNIFFSDSILNGNAKVFDEFMDLMIDLKKEHKVIWTTFMGFREELTDARIRKMHAAGCWRVFWGFESGSQHVLDLMRKNYSLENAKRIIRTCHTIGIESYLPLIVGFPGETMQDYISTVEFVQEYRVYGTFLDPGHLQVLPLSNLHKNYKDFNLANNHIVEWLTLDNRNNPSTRLFRAFILRNILHNTRCWNPESIGHLDFNEYSLASEIASFLYGIAQKSGLEEEAAAFLRDWRPQANALPGAPDLEYWRPDLIPGAVDLRNWFSAEKNGAHQRQRIISFIMGLLFRNEIQSVAGLPPIESIPRLSGTTQCGIETINGTPLTDTHTGVRRMDIHGDDLFIDGWALDDLSHGPAGGVYVKIGDELLPAHYGFRNQEQINKYGDTFSNCGFSRRILASDLGEGEHRISLVVLTAGRNGYFESGNPVDIRITR